jgi:hypothetical protein
MAGASISTLIPRYARYINKPSETKIEIKSIATYGRKEINAIRDMKKAG